MGDNLKDAAKILGSLGERKTLRKYGKKYFKKSGRSGFNANLSVSKIL
jgi:hypothetical protein